MVILCLREKSSCVYGDLDIICSSAMQSYYHSQALPLLCGESLEMRASLVVNRSDWKSECF